MTRCFPVLLGLCCILPLGGCGARPVDRYPTRPIKLIVPFAAGGGTDAFARIMKKAIDDHQLLDETMVIINIGGAGGTIGSRRVKNARPDGYTLLLSHDAIMTAKAYGTVGYGLDAFQPIAGTGEVEMVIAAADESPHRDLTQLLRATRQAPDAITFGVNLGATSHFIGLQLEDQYPGARFRFVQGGGGAKRFADLKGRHVDVTSFSLEEFLRFRDDGLRGLALLSDQRHPAMPDVPTAREQDCRLTTTNVFYWCAPRETPDRIVNQLAGALQAAVRTDYVQRKLSELHCRPVFLRGEELNARVADDQRRYEAVSPRENIDLPNFPAILLFAIVFTWGAVFLENRLLRAS